MLRGKQAEIVRFADSRYSALICDGAIRSGKTSIMIIAFVDWAMRKFENCNFGICGKTVLSARRNIIEPFLHLSYARKRYAITDRRSDNAIIISAKRCGREVTNKFYIFGGKDESSQNLIQGVTLAGVLLDEVALMPESFVNQATARCSVDGSKFWFSCNPESPEHWFKKKWIDCADERNAYHLHFVLDDNPSLSQEIKERYKGQYSGVFYRRYILGEWAVADGVVYECFDRELNAITRTCDYAQHFVSIDYGTYNPFAALLWGKTGDEYHLLSEYYHDGRRDGQRTDTEHADALFEFAGDYPVSSIIIDPSAASFIAELKRRGANVRKAANDVIPGIALTHTLIQQRKIKIASCCENTLKEMASYCWDSKSQEDKPVKQDDHAMDAMRYFVYTVARNAAHPKLNRSLIGGI